MAEGVKITDLLPLPTNTILDTDLWEVVRNGNNYKITGAIFKSEMAVYGGGGTGGGISDVPDTTVGGKLYVRESRVGNSGIWTQITLPPAYTLPVASSSTLGGIKIGGNLSIDGYGTLSVPIIPDTNGSVSSAFGAVKVDGTTIVSVGGVLTAYGSAGGGSVISVGLTLPSIFSVTNSPITTSGNLTATLTTQSANTIFAGPASGSATIPSFRALVVADIPSITSSELYTKLTDKTGTGLSVFSDSPAFSGTPTAPTPSAGDNTTKLATTAFVKAAVDGLSYSYETNTSNIKMNGTVSVGTASTLPRADHVHPTDTTRAAKNGSASEAFTASSITCSSLILNGHTLTIS